MEHGSSDFNGFMAYLIGGVLLAVAVATWGMVWQRRRRRRERQAASKASQAKLRAWRAGK